MIASRTAAGVVTLVLVSMLVFTATQILPGNAATAILRNTATPTGVRVLEKRLHLNESAPEQYLRWAGGLLHGSLGTSLASGTPVSKLLGPMLENSAWLVVLAGIISTILGVTLGVLAAARRDSLLDQSLSFVALCIIALPEFAVAIGLVVLFSTVVLQVLPAVSNIPSGASPISNPKALVLPVASLVLVTAPYLFRMVRAAMIDALAADYTQMAELKGLSRRRILFVHALTNSAAPAIQVIGLNLLYLSGGIVVVEYIFNYPGIGQGLVTAISDRDVPMIQIIVLALAAFYVLVNLVCDIGTILVTPRRRRPRGA
jgi:peptide/nickel transport system permease protein